MATDINIVVLVGRLTRESDLKYTNSGTAVCKFSLAVNRRKRTGDKWEDEVSFIDVVLWGKSAEALHPYLDKGKQVSIAGELRQSRWEQDGQSRSKIEVIANTVELLGGQGNSQQSGKSYNSNQGSARQSSYSSKPRTSDASQNRAAASTQADPKVPSFNGPEEFDDEDIPF